MSVAVVIVPVLIAAWPVITALVSTAAAGLGYKMLKQKAKSQQSNTAENEIEICDEKSQVVEEALKPEEELVFEREGVTVTFKKDAREKFTICVKGENKTSAELNKIGRSFLNKVKQQYAYQKVRQEMTKRGFTVVEEETQGKQIKLLLRKF